MQGALLKAKIYFCGEGACSRWTGPALWAQKAQERVRFAAQREQAPSPQVFFCLKCFAAFQPYAAPSRNCSA